jgi:hypothetical protein
LDTDASIEEEYAEPILVDYKDPKPICVCPDLGEENLVKIAETAYNILKTETELNHQMNESLKKKKNQAVDNTMEGGTSDRSSHKSIVPITFTKPQDYDGDKTPEKNFPVIMHPPESEVETIKNPPRTSHVPQGDIADDILSENLSPREETLRPL